VPPWFCEVCCEYSATISFYGEEQSFAAWSKEQGFAAWSREQGFAVRSTKKFCVFGTLQHISRIKIKPALVKLL
jgi:hypothetical protein